MTVSVQSSECRLTSCRHVELQPSQASNYSHGFAVHVLASGLLERSLIDQHLRTCQLKADHNLLGTTASVTVRDGSCCGGQLLSSRSAVSVAAGTVVVGRVFVVRSSCGWMVVVGR